MTWLTRVLTLLFAAFAAGALVVAALGQYSVMEFACEGEPATSACACAHPVGRNHEHPLEDAPAWTRPFCLEFHRAFRAEFGVTPRAFQAHR